MSYETVTAVIENVVLCPGARSLSERLVALAVVLEISSSLENRDEPCVKITSERIAEKTGACLRTVRAALNSLCADDGGVFSRKKERNGYVYSYRKNLPVDNGSRHCLPAPNELDRHLLPPTKNNMRHLLPVEESSEIRVPSEDVIEQPNKPQDKRLVGSDRTVENGTSIYNSENNKHKNNTSGELGWKSVRLPRAARNSKPIISAETMRLKNTYVETNKWKPTDEHINRANELIESLIKAGVPIEKLEYAVRGAAIDKGPLTSKNGRVYSRFHDIFRYEKVVRSLSTKYEEYRDREIANEAHRRKEEKRRYGIDREITEYQEFNDRVMELKKQAREIIRDAAVDTDNAACSTHTGSALIPDSIRSCGL